MKTKLLSGVNVFLFIGIIWMWKKVFFVKTGSDFYIWAILLVSILVATIVFLIRDFYPKKVSLFRTNVYIAALLSIFLIMECVSFGVSSIHYPDVQLSNIKKVVLEGTGSSQVIAKDSESYTALTDYLSSFHYRKACSSEDPLMGTMDQYYTITLKDSSKVQLYGAYASNNELYYSKDGETYIYKVAQ